jgi:ribosomal protein L14
VHSLARRSDGSVVAWGDNSSGQCNVLALPPGSSYVEVAGGWNHTVARRSDGSVVAWGDNSYGQGSVPALPPGLSYVEVAAGGLHSVARRSDGSVVAWGDNSYGQCNVLALPPGLSYVEIAGGGLHSVARRSDGSVVAWGDNTYGQCNVPAMLPGSSYVEVAAHGNRTVARLGPSFPMVYCTAKTTSSGCLPAIVFSGAPSASAGSAFLITASQVEPQQFGIFFYGTSGKVSAPFLGGTLCVQRPLVRTALQHSGGSAPCSGGLSMDFNAYVASGKDPLLSAGVTVDGQYWFLDPGFAPPNDAGLTDAIEFTLAP